MSEDLKQGLKKKFEPSLWRGWRVFRSYTKAGMNLIKEVNELDPDLVIDVGCGHNRFKGHIKNLIGFDQSPFPYADLHMDIDEINFRKESADVALVLGSIQFGNRDIVERHLEKVVSWVKPGGFLVMRTMLSHIRDYPYQDIHYIWSEEDVEYFSKKFNLEIVKGPWIDDANNKKGEYVGNRVVWWWQKPGKRKKFLIQPKSCNIVERP